MIKVKNLNDKAELYIWGEIIDDTDAQWLKIDGNGELIGFEFPDKIKEQLDKLKGFPIDVHIASDGGSVAAGIAIFNMLKNHNAEVNVYIDSWAASIASLVAFAGKKIYMPENTFLMIHNPKAGGFGEADYLRSIATWLDKIKNMIANTYKEHTDTNVEELMDKETWITAKEAAEMFDNVELMASNEIAAVAKYKTKFKTAPKNLVNNDVKHKIIKILTEAFEK